MHYPGPKIEIDKSLEKISYKPYVVILIKKTIKYVNTASSGAGAVNPVWRG